MPLMPLISCALLTFEHYAHSCHLTSKWWRDFSHPALRFANLRETEVQGIYDVLCHALYGVLCALHLLAHHLVHRQIVHRLGYIIVLGYRSQFGCQAQRNLEVATRLSLQLVATVEGVEVHTLQLYFIQFLLHYSTITR